jgi:hypothetical protein
MPRKAMLLMLGALAPLNLSCNLLVPAIFIGEHRKRVSAEFDKLENHRVAVMVWTDPSTLFDYPYARYELASYVFDKLRAEMAQRKLAIDLVEPREVEDYLQKKIGTQIDPHALGQAFKADYIVYLEVLKFQMRDARLPQFLRGEIDASVSVHDIHADPDQLSRYELAPVACQYPEGAPLLINATNAPLVREATYRKFAEQVARKFYEHHIDL